MSEVGGSIIGELAEYPTGNVVFFESARGNLNNRHAIEKMSNALDLLGIPCYIIQLDEMVEENLNLGSTKPANKRKKSISRPRPRYMVGNAHSSSRLKVKGKPEPPETSRRPRRKLSQRSRELKAQETEAHLNILGVNVQEVSGANPDGWVLIVETEMKRALDILKLDDLAEHFCFKIHWFTTASKRRSELRFNEIVVDILKDKNERRRKITGVPRTPCDSRIVKSSKAADNSSTLEVLHGLKRVMSNSSSVCSTGSKKDDDDGSSKMPPHFKRRNQNSEDSSGNLDGQESVTTLVTTDSGGSLSSTFEVRSSEDMSLYHKLPPPDLDRLLDVGTRDADDNIVEQRKTYVVTIRDLFPGARSNLAMTLKTMLRREGIRAYIMSVSNMFTQPYAVKLMKEYSERAGHGSTEIGKGCKVLIMNGIHFKLSEQRHQVILVDLEDESVVRMFSIYDFCVKIGVKTLALEKAADGSFERNLSKVYNTIRKGLSAPHKPRKYKLPKITSELLEQLNPVVVVGSDLVMSVQNTPSSAESSGQSESKVMIMTATAVPPSQEMEPDENSNVSTAVMSDAADDVDKLRSYGTMLQEQTDSKDFCTNTYDRTAVSASSIDLEELRIREYEAIQENASKEDISDYEDAPQESSSYTEASQSEEILSSGEEATSKSQPSQTTIVRKPSIPVQEIIATDEEEGPIITSLDYIPKLPVPPPNYKEDSDTDIPSFKPRNKPNLIEIQRWDEREPVGKKRDVRYLSRLPSNRVGNIDTSDESLFRGWVGKVKQPNRVKKPWLIKRVMTGIQRGFMKYVISPVGRMFTGRK